MKSMIFLCVAVFFFAYGAVGLSGLSLATALLFHLSEDTKNEKQA